jgi:hypothetical protein
MTIKLLARPLVQLWEDTPEWTSLTFEGDDEETVANIVTASLLMARHEVQLDEEDEALEPMEVDDGEAS